MLFVFSFENCIDTVRNSLNHRSTGVTGDLNDTAITFFTTYRNPANPT